MNFGQALEALKNGSRVSRAGWNGKGMWLALIPADGGVFTKGGDRLEMQPCIGMKTAAPGGEMQPGWLASQADMLADDWESLDSGTSEDRLIRRVRVEHDMHYFECVETGDMFYISGKELAL